jgi:HrpA-like RNA helicase
LPVDTRLAKLILFGHVFGKLREAIIIAASLSVKDLFARYSGSNFEAYK